MRSHKKREEKPGRGVREKKGGGGTEEKRAVSVKGEGVSLRRGERGKPHLHGFLFSSKNGKGKLLMIMHLRGR